MAIILASPCENGLLVFPILESLLDINHPLSGGISYYISSVRFVIRFVVAMPCHVRPDPGKRWPTDPASTRVENPEASSTPIPKTASN